MFNFALNQIKLDYTEANFDCTVSTGLTITATITAPSADYTQNVYIALASGITLTLTLNTAVTSSTTVPEPKGFIFHSRDRSKAYLPKDIKTLKARALTRFITRKRDGRNN